ncbi:MAG: molybdopterin cofactor-binding domain-containing protein [Leadbetterella sp.]
MRSKTSRRTFLKISTLATGGLLVSFTSSVSGQKSNLNTPIQLNPFLRISEENSITITLSKVEMGQGIWTTLPMLIAEELDCDWSKIKVEHSPSGTSKDFLESPIFASTGGSETTKSEFDKYRVAGATARALLVQAAANRWNISPIDCKTENGFVLYGDKQISYGELATEASHLSIPTVKLKEPKDWKIIGKSKNRLDNPEKINGSSIYGIDIQFPEVFTTLVAHPPVFSAKVRSYDPSKTLLIKGVREVVQIPTGIAVIADTFWAAKKEEML